MNPIHVADRLVDVYVAKYVRPFASTRRLRPFGSWRNIARAFNSMSFSVCDLKLLR